MKKIPFSKFVVGFTLVVCTSFIVFCCCEMHRLCDLTALAYIGTAVVALNASALGFYIWRARATDAYELAKMEAFAEKKFKLPIETEKFMDDMNQYK